MAARVIHFEVQADDLARAKKFYETVFGWKTDLMMKADPMKPDSMDYWGLTTGPEGTPGINCGLFERPKEKDKQHHLYYCTILVDDIDASIRDVKKNGGKIVREKDMIPKVGWFASAVDTEGNMFALMQATDWKPM